MPCLASDSPGTSIRLPQATDIRCVGAVPGPSRDARYSAHGAIGDSIVSHPGLNLPANQAAAASLASNGADNLWGPISKQSSSSSFWGGHPLESDPVPESVQV